MIGRLLASAALLVALAGTAMAQMTAPPPANPGPSGPNAAPMNSGPGKASPGALNGGHTLNNRTHVGTNSTSAGQAAASGPRSLHPEASRSSGSNMNSARQTAQGQGQNNLADKLNACEAKPVSERQACISAATRM